MMPQIAKPNQDLKKIALQIVELIAKKSSGVIVLPARASQDAVAAGASLYLTLLKMGKNVTICSSTIPKSEFIGADKISTQFDSGGSNLVISFPYKEGTIDKVDYNIQGDRFNMIIVPIEGQNKLQPEQVQYTYTGGKADFIIIIDTPNLNSLGEIYTKNQQKFDSSTIINIDRHMINNNYGMINMVAKSISSTSELVLKLVQELKVEIDRDIATNLYAGITSATNNFTAYSVNADTFEAVAVLLRAGAEKRTLTAPPGLYPTRNSFGGQFYPEYEEQPNFEQSFAPIQPQFRQPNYAPQRSVMQRSAQANAPARQAYGGQKSRSISQIEKAPSDKENKSTKDDNPENFLKPQVFSESGLV